MSEDLFLLLNPEDRLRLGVKSCVGNRPEALRGVPPVKDLEARGKTHQHQLPDPVGTIGNADKSFGLGNTTPFSFGPLLVGKGGNRPYPSLGNFARTGLSQFHHFAD